MSLSLYDANKNYQNYCMSGEIYGEYSYDNKKMDTGSFLNLSFGSSYNTIKIDNIVDDSLLDDVRLFVGISAMTKTGGTYVRGVNALGIYMFDSFSLFQNGKEKEKVYPDQIFYNILYNSTAERWSRISADIGYDTSTSNRNTLASSAQNFSIPLKWIFQFFASPLNLNLYKELEIRFVLRTDIRQCIQTDGTNPNFTFTDLYLDRRWVKPFSNQIISKHQELVIGGHLLHFDYEYLAKDFQVLAGATSYAADVKEFLGKNVQDFMVIIRPKSAIKTNNTSDYTDSNISASTWNIKSGNKFLTRYEQDVTSQYYKRIQLARMSFLGVQNVYQRNEFVVSFAKNYLTSSTDTQMNWSSSQSFIGISDATINITFPALVADSTITVLARFAKLIYRDSQGNYESQY
jgi:hypothetical protein